MDVMYTPQLVFTDFALLSTVKYNFWAVASLAGIKSRQSRLFLSYLLPQQGKGCGFVFCISSCKLLEFRDGETFVEAVAQPPSFFLVQIEKEWRTMCVDFHAYKLLSIFCSRRWLWSVIFSFWGEEPLNWLSIKIQNE